MKMKSMGGAVADGTKFHEIPVIMSSGYCLSAAPDMKILP
jgi:hypothetical protein